MPLGDSIAKGYGPHDSYRWYLWRLIRQSGFDVDFVGSVHNQVLPYPDFDTDHEGHWGFWSTQVLDGLPVWLSENTHDIVLLHIGTNDVGECRSPNETAKTTERIIDLIQERNPKAIILLAKIIPIDFDGQCGWGRSVDEAARQLNQRLEVISSNKPNIVMVDLFSALDAKLDLRDAAHPNEQVFDTMAHAWFRALKPILVPPR